MTRVATFTPVITLDLDTQAVTINFSGSLQQVTYNGDHFGPRDGTERDDETVAGGIMDKILEHFPHTEPLDQARVLRNLAQHIDNFTIQEFP